MKTHTDTFEPSHSGISNYTPTPYHTARCQKLSDIRTNLFIRKQALTRRANLMFWIAWAALTIALALLSLSGFSMEPYVVSSIVIMMLVTVAPERIIKKRIAKKERQISRVGRKIGVLI